MSPTSSKERGDGKGQEKASRNGRHINGIIITPDGSKAVVRGRRFVQAFVDWRRAFCFIFVATLNQPDREARGPRGSVNWTNDSAQKTKIPDR
jgi:hypothetical protein